MAFNLGLAQCRHPQDNDPVSLVERFAAEAVQKNVELLVFPESLMTPYEKELGKFLRDAEPVTGQFASSVNKIAQEHNLWIVYTVNEQNPSGNPFNTAVLVDPTGSQRMIYRKVHLFDSSSTQESNRMSAGAKFPIPLKMPFATVSFGICYDLRFPEVARYASLRGTELMLYPAAWVAGENKIEQWRTLLQARAIENEMYVAGVSRCDDGYIGSSCIVNPQGNIIASAGKNEELLVASIDVSEIYEMRNALPVFEHRKPELYLEP